MKHASCKLFLVFLYSPTEVAGNIVNSALNVATHAAATAYTTAKDVLHTLQARNEVRTHAHIQQARNEVRQYMHRQSKL